VKASEGSKAVGIQGPGGLSGFPIPRTHPHKEPNVSAQPDLEIDDEVAEAPAVDWSKARCNDGNGTLTHLFFSEDLIDIARAKAICSKCALAVPCLSEALERQEPWGVWGGHLLLNGQIVAHKRRRGRPPKHPRPELVVDEVPLPPHYVKTA
jgi:WhiB family redox-sensing transcriptional regulator